MDCMVSGVTGSRPKAHGTTQNRGGLNAQRPGEHSVIVRSLENCPELAAF